jgi:hypothetical protein
MKHQLYADALAHNEAEISSLVDVYSLISQMRILSSLGVVERAEALIRMIVDTYFTPNKKLPELRGLIDSHTLDPLRAFSEELGGV